jgi:hypothetical protein
MSLVLGQLQSAQPDDRIIIPAWLLVLHLLIPNTSYVSSSRRLLQYG